MSIPEELKDNDLIYHYTKSSIAMESILYSGRLRFSPLREMNDPYEYQIVTMGIISRGGTISEDRHETAMNKLRTAILVDSKIASFVYFGSLENIDPFNLPFTKPRLWAQYGDKQFGVCLGFSKKQLLENIKNRITDISVYESAVSYDLNLNDHSKKNSLMYDNKESIENNIYRHIDSNKNDIYFRKYNDFVDEKEYRIVLFDKSPDDRQYLFCPIEDSLKVLILGDRFPIIYYDTIKKLCCQYGATAYLLKYGPRTPYIGGI